MSDQIFELKGNLFTLSVLHLYKNELVELSKQLDKKIAQAPKFFDGAPIVVNFETIKSENIDFNKLISCLNGLKLNLVGICNGSDNQHAQAKSNGLAVLNYSKDNKPSQSNQKSVISNTSVIEKTVYLPAQIINGTVRSGQQVYAKDRDLVVLGSVGHGAEVIADGNVHIYGTLRGRAICGAKGNNEALIYCHKLEAELVSVNGNYWLSDSLQSESWGSPCTIQLINDSLLIKNIA